MLLSDSHSPIYHINGIHDRGIWSGCWYLRQLCQNLWTMWFKPTGKVSFFVQLLKSVEECWWYYNQLVVEEFPHVYVTNHGDCQKPPKQYISVKYQLAILSFMRAFIISHTSASWTLTKAHKKRLDAFNTKALRRIVGVRWHDFVTNASILIRTGQPPLMTTIRKLRLSAFGHICRLQPGTQAIDILASTPPSTWHRPRGRPPLRWADQIVNDTQLSLSDAVTATQDRTSWRSLVRDATRPATQAN